jgi:hypothetical protein
MHQYDVRLKLILQEAVPALLRLLGLPPVIEYLTVEFPKKSKMLPDLLVRLADWSILHIELQSKNDLRIAWRCLEYWLAIAEQWPDARIHQVVIYLGGDPLTMVSSIRRDGLRFDLDILNLEDVPASAFLSSESAGERALAVLCQTDDPKATIEAILGSWKHLPAKELHEKISSLGVLSQLKKRARIVEEVAKAMPVELDLEENEFFQWIAQKGAAKAEARGEARGEAKMLVRFLERRFGPLSEPVRERVGGADVETLDRWADRLDSATALDDVFE